jgi:mono/diheme cytochrome c family protein
MKTVFSLRSTVYGLLAFVLASAWVPGAVTSARQRTAWDGIYSAQQAERGRAGYMQSCAACHAEDLRGRATAPSLVEESFAYLYNDVSVGELLDKIQKLMPSDRPGPSCLPFPPASAVRRSEQPPTTRAPS